MKIRPSVNIIDSIGKNLVIDEISAIVELIKNSYDADAENIFLRFENTEKGLIITIKDDGHGMDMDIIEKSWMVPATSYKISNKYSQTKKRRVLGEKGLGRYSVFILGEKVKLETVKNKEKVTLLIDWEEIKKVQYLDELDFDISYEKTTEANGTKLTIYKKQIEKWHINKIMTLEKELKKLLSPIYNDDDFNIYVEYINMEEKEGEYKLEPYKLFDYYDYKMVAEISNDIIANYSIYGKGDILLKSDKILNLKKELENQGLNFPGEFKLEFRIFTRDEDDYKNFLKQFNLDNDKFGRKEMKKLLDELSGISIYKNNFRIRPYGEESVDWLELNKRRVQSPTYRLSTNQINGIINLAEDINLKEKSARDGLQEDSYFLGLKYIVTKLLIEIESKRTVEKEKYQKEQNKYKSEKINFKKIGDYTIVKKQIKEELFGKIPEEGLQKIEEFVTKKEKEDLKEIEKIEEVMSSYRKNITLGQLIDYVLHEGRKPIFYFNNMSTILIKSLKNFIKEYDLKLIENVETIVEGYKDQSKIMSNLFKMIEPLSVKTKGPKRKFLLNKCIEKSLYVFQSDLEEVNLNLKLEEILIVGYEDEFQVALTNLIQNSLYWMATTDKEKQLDINLYKKEKKIIIELIDNGPGIDKELIDNGQIFKIGFSKKIEGKGLGLAIAGEALERNDFLLSVKSYDKGAFFVIENKEEGEE